MNKSGKSEGETIFGIVIFIIILIVFITKGIFSTILKGFNDPIFGGFGVLLGSLFIFIIIATLFQKILGKWTTKN